MATMKHLAPLLAVAIASAGPLLAQERVSLQQHKIAVSDTDGDEVVSLGHLTPCPGILLREPTTNLTTLSFGACAPVLSLGSGDFAGALQLWGEAGVTISLDALTGRGVLGQLGQPGALEVRDSDGFTTGLLLGVDGSLRLGSTADDGDIIVMDAAPDQESFRVDGNTGNVTNQLGGNGTVKAWAEINSTGSILACWRCSAVGTGKIETGQYSVSFSPLGSNIDSRPRMASIDSHGSGAPAGFATVADAGDGVVVHTRNTSGTLADLPFTVFIF